MKLARSLKEKYKPKKQTVMFIQTEIEKSKDKMKSNVKNKKVFNRTATSFIGRV